MKKRILSMILALVMVLGMTPMLSFEAEAYYGNEMMASGDADVVDAIMVNLLDYSLRVVENESDIVLTLDDPMSMFVDSTVEMALTCVPVYGPALSTGYGYAKLTAEALWELGEALAQVGSARAELLQSSLFRAAKRQQVLIEGVSNAYLCGISDYENGKTTSDEDIRLIFGEPTSTEQAISDLRGYADNPVFAFDRESAAAIDGVADALEELARNLPDVVSMYQMGYDVSETRAKALEKSSYNASAAVKYARENWNNGIGKCAHFVSSSLNAGGVEIPNYSYFKGTDASYQNCNGNLGDYVNPFIASAALLKYLGEVLGYEVIKAPKESQMELGDVVFMYPTEIGKNPDSHVAIITKVDNGQAYYSAHNIDRLDRAVNPAWCTYLVKMDGVISEKPVPTPDENISYDIDWSKITATDPVEKMVQIAESQIGYFETYGADGAQARQPKSTGTHYYNKYSAEVGSNAKAWCTVFLYWCAQKAGISDEIIPYSVNTEPYTKSSANITYHLATEGYVPKVGDIAVFDWPGTSFTHDHAEFVTAVNTSNKIVTTVGGNTSYINADGSREYYAVGTKNNFRYDGTALSDGSKIVAIAEIHYESMEGTEPTPDPNTKTQYRYHMYVSEYGERSVCAYSGASNPDYKGTTFVVEYTDWLDEPLPVDNAGYRYFQHILSDKCASYGCTDETFYGNRHRDAEGKTWFYEETRTVAVECSHSWGEGTVISDASCTENGEMSYVCTLCGESKTETIAAAGHTYTAVVTAPTCTEQGYTTYTCACGDSYVGEKVPATGHEWDDGKVTKEPTEEAEGEKTFTCTVCGETRTETIAKLEPVVNPFNDIAEEDYYFAPVMWAVQKGVTSGLSADSFGPAAGCTRAQVVTFLWRAAGEPAPKSGENPFKDVAEGQYYYNAVLWAVENGITSGLSADSFGPDANCNRGQIVTFLWRAAGEPAPTSDANPFKDVDKAMYYYDAVLWAVENGITSGVSADSFAPDTTCTRGQIVTFLYRNDK